MRGIIFSLHFRNDSSFSPGLNSFFVKIMVFKNKSVNFLSIFIVKNMYNEDRNTAFNATLFYILYDQIFIYAKLFKKTSFLN